MIFGNHDFHDLCMNFPCMTGRRMLRTPSLSKRECPKFIIRHQNIRKAYVFIRIDKILFVCSLVCSTKPPSGNQVDGLPLAASICGTEVLQSRRGSKNLLQRGILYRHEKILLRQGRLQAQTQEKNVGTSDARSSGESM